MRDNKGANGSESRKADVREEDSKDVAAAETGGPPGRRGGDAGAHPGSGCGPRARQRTSMVEIAEAAGVGRSTLYRHFPSRQALRQALQTRAPPTLCRASA
jgi:hypothetical protein